jgi:hypothetical protein
LKLGTYDSIFHRWFWPHATIQFFIAGPIIFAGWALGYKTSTQLGQGQFVDPHQKCGLALLILYLIQITLGASAHFFKFPKVFRGHREPLNYIHLTVGIAIFILAAFQVRQTSIVLNNEICPGHGIGGWAGELIGQWR